MDVDNTLDPTIEMQVEAEGDGRGYIADDLYYDGTYKLTEVDWINTLMYKEYSVQLDEDTEVTNKLIPTSPAGEYEIVLDKEYIAEYQDIYGNYEITLSKEKQHYYDTITPYDLSNKGDNISIVYENKNADDDNYTAVAYDTDGYPYNGREYRVRVEANKIGQDPVTYVLYDDDFRSTRSHKA